MLKSFQAPVSNFGVWNNNTDPALDDDVESFTLIPILKNVRTRGMRLKPKSRRRQLMQLLLSQASLFEKLYLLDVLDNFGDLRLLALARWLLQYCP